MDSLLFNPTVSCPLNLSRKSSSSSSSSSSSLRLPSLHINFGPPSSRNTLLASASQNHPHPTAPPECDALPQIQHPHPEPEPEPEPEQEQEPETDESYGEVKKIIGSRAAPAAVDGKPPQMEYLIEWEDGHAPSWVPSDYIAADVLAEYETSWWSAARKADESALRSLLASGARDVDAVDRDGRTALLFVSGLGSETCIRALAECGAHLYHQDVQGLTALHMAAGYVKPAAVRALVQLGADPEVADGRGQTPLDLAKELLRGTPKGNPAQFGRRVGLEAVVRELEAAVYEYAEVEKVVEKRGRGERVQYLVTWKDGGPNEWVPQRWVAEDLVRDFEAGLEYGIVEKVLGSRGEGAGREFLVKWADIEDATWEPEENVDPTVVAQFLDGQEAVPTATTDPS